jgi:tetratricopeptide (TPR) repeat protein
MIRLAAWLATTLAAAVVPSGTRPGSDMFTVHDDGVALTVSANRAAVPGDIALRELSRALGWTVRYQAGAFEKTLADTTVDLSFRARGPRTIANLIAVSAGTDVVFIDREVDGKSVTEVVVVGIPDPTAEDGRRRLRDWAIEWYRTFLDEDTREGSERLAEALRVRMQLSDLLRQQGALVEAASILEKLYEIAPDHDYVPAALMRMAQCWFEAGPETWPDAERRARDLTRLHPSRPEAAQGTILLGRILLEEGRYSECIATLERSALRLAGTPEIVDLYLLLAFAHFRSGDPDAVLRTLATLEDGHLVERLPVEQRTQWLFLRGYAATERGDSKRAVRLLEQFLSGDRRKDELQCIGFVLLARAYVAEQRYLQARAAALSARRDRALLDRRWSRASSEIWATTAAALGEEDRALLELEVEIRHDVDSDPELALFLANLLLEHGRTQRSLGLLGRLLDREDDFGDRARALRVDALYRQAQAAGTLQRFVTEAIEVAPTIIDPERQRRVAQIVGEVYERLGEAEKAADAYRGVLR